MKKLAEISIFLDGNHNVNIALTSKNIITNLGMLELAKEMVKTLCGGAPQQAEEERIIKPRISLNGK